LIRTVGLLLLLIASAGGTWLLIRQASEPEAPATASIDDADLGYYLLDASLIGHDDAGSELYTLHADRIEQASRDGSVTLTHVTMDYASRSAAPWRVEADFGRIPASGDLIDLEGNVRLARAGDSDDALLTIATTRLQLAPRERIARTDATVDVTQGSDTLTATGLEADLSNERVTLGARVRARFQQGASG
jgi:lipopolysaccharide export system protein LptC